METSYNGWHASPTLSNLDAIRFEVPTVPNRSFTTVRVAAPLFKYLIRRFDAEVDPLGGGVMDEWSYNYRKARAANALSCHASATAVDLDATQFPMGRTNMTKQQKAAVNRILSATRKQFRWGGTFSKGFEDEMHFELVKGTNPTTVKAAISVMGLHDDGRVFHPGDVSPQADPNKIRLLKKALAKVNLYPSRPVYNGKWTEALGNAYAAWLMRRPKEAKQTRLDALGKASGLF